MDIDNAQTGKTGGSQQALFPEDATPAQGNALAQQLATASPDDLAAMAQALDPDVRSTLAQALFSAMSPEEKAAIDNTPGSDVQAGMAGAAPERPEQQYQMSITRAMKRCEATPGMEMLAADHLDKWKSRITSLHEDGYLSDEDADAMHKSFAKDGQNKFSILLSDRGFLRDHTIAIEALEKSRAGQAKLSETVLQKRFGIAKPVLPSAEVKKQAGESEQFNREEAEKAGSRLARYN